ncbi:MAG: hypothetical protein M1830_006992 [Pleopsidium flavum]|nr:MAG: hypothetical protein M1830_006992 [Pleopsidium flavum]
MISFLLNRSLGTISPENLQRAQTARLLHAIQPAPSVRFRSNDARIPIPSTQEEQDVSWDDSAVDLWAHKAGVNSLTIDRFEGRYLLSGGADSSILLWDLEDVDDTAKRCEHQPAAAVYKSSSAHKFGITHLSFYPFDSLAFLSSSYDHSLKIYATETLTPSASFDLGSVIYSHTLSPIASHLLVACATQHPAVRLVDLRTGASAHSLAGHQGAVLSVAWSPREEYILASGGVDGTVRLWDIRRSAGSLGVLDLEDSVGITGEDGLGKGARQRERGKAHVGAVNGVVWTDSGDYIVTAGHDERVRVWDAATGANALAHFGPIIKNTNLSTLLPLIAPSIVVPLGKQIMFFPNGKEILVFDLFQGTLLKRLRATGVAVAQARGSAGQRNIKNRVTSLAWRAGHIELYSAHSDGVIRAWMPRTREEAGIDEDDEINADNEDMEAESKKRKRKALEDVYQDLTKRKITFR